MSAKLKRLVYFTWMNPAISEGILRGRKDIEAVKLLLTGDEQENWAAFSGAHGYQTLARGELREPWFSNTSLIQRCPSLLAICAYGAGYDTIDVDACTRGGVIVCNQAGMSRESVAQHALGLMLALCKKIASADRALRRSNYTNRWALQNNDLYGKTLGIVGIGNIGGRLAQICKTFAMPVLAYDPYLTEKQIAERGARKVDLEELLSQSDFVSINCPLSGETTGMLGRKQFALMKPTAFFITTARGGIHKEDELAEALKAGRIAGAGLDVFLKEPPAMDHPLLQFDNVIATPHIAGVTDETLNATAASAAEQWITIFEGKIPPGLVNPQAWPRYSERFEELLGVRPAALAALS